MAAENMHTGEQMTSTAGPRSAPAAGALPAGPRMGVNGAPARSALRLLVALLAGVASGRTTGLSSGLQAGRASRSTLSGEDRVDAGSRAGQVLLSVAAVGSALAPLLEDWSRRHTFAPHWPGHARYHEALAILSQASFGGLSLWLLWRRPSTAAERDLSMKVAALIPALTWGPALPALLAPGASLDNPPTEIPPRVLGVPVNLPLMLAPALLAGLGYWLDRRARRDR